MIPADLESFHSSFWNLTAHNFDMTTNEGCGLYTEAFVKYSQQNGYPKVGHLKKNPGQTQYNGHANDAFLYADGTGNPDGLYQAVDIIASAEAKPPYNVPPNFQQPPHVNFGIDDPRYTSADWMKEPQSNPAPSANLVPWVSYFGDAANAEFKRTLAYDYARRPQGVDWDVSVWSFRTVYTALMGLLSPSQGGSPLGLIEAVKHHRVEWCEALHVTVIPIPPTWQIGDPV